MDLNELRAAAEAAKQRAATARLSEEEAELARLHTELAEAEAETQAALRARRELRGKALEVETKKATGGKYLVRFIDLGALLPEADPASLPGEGVLVVRSPPTHPVDALGNFYREVEAKARPLPDVYADLVCESVVFPDISKAGIGEGLRAFFETSLGRGTVIIVGDTVTDLGGIRGKATKRGRG